MEGGSFDYPFAGTRTVDISALAAGHNSIQIRFHYYNANYEWYWAIDNVEVLCGNPICNICGGTPDIDVTPASVDFGQVMPSTTASTELTVQNLGNTSLTIQSVSMTGDPAFSLAGDTCSRQVIPSQQFCTITVNFNPPATGTYQASVVITSDDPDENPLTVSLSGKGVQPVLVPQKLTINDGQDGILEPGETAEVQPEWTNTSGVLAPDVTGSLSDPFLINLLDSNAHYGEIPANASVSCLSTGDCYTLTITGTPPSDLHRDAMVTESLNMGQNQIWLLHIGESFTDVSPSSPFYGFVETLLHYDITRGCQLNNHLYCPQAFVPRRQMAMFLARALAGG